MRKLASDLCYMQAPWQMLLMSREEIAVVGLTSRKGSCRRLWEQRSLLSKQSIKKMGGCLSAMSKRKLVADLLICSFICKHIEHQWLWLSLC